MTDSKEAAAKDVECVICMEVPTVRGSIPCCDHVFCFDCILKWSEQENTCPLCKKRFRQVDKIEPAGNSRKRKARGNAGVQRTVKVQRRNQSHTPQYQGAENVGINFGRVILELMSNLQGEVQHGLPRIIEEEDPMPFGLTMLPLLMRQHRHIAAPRTTPRRGLRQRGDVGTSAANPVEIDDESPTTTSSTRSASGSSGAAASEPEDGDLDVQILDGDGSTTSLASPLRRRATWRVTRMPGQGIFRADPWYPLTPPSQPPGLADSLFEQLSAVDLPLFDPPTPPRTSTSASTSSSSDVGNAPPQPSPPTPVGLRRGRRNRTSTQQPNM